MSKSDKLKANLLISGALVTPFIFSSTMIFLPNLVSPIFTFLVGPGKKSLEMMEPDNLYRLAIFYTLSIAPGLSCFLCLKNHPLKRVMGGTIYVLVMLLLLYAYMLILSLKRSGYV